MKFNKGDRITVHTLFEHDSVVFPVGESGTILIKDTTCYGVEWDIRLHPDFHDLCHRCVDRGWWVRREKINMFCELETKNPSWEL